jgi:hypothetical protein
VWGCLLTVINSYYKPSIKHEKEYKFNHHHRIGTQLTEFHEFWWIMVFQGLNRKKQEFWIRVGPKEPDQIASNGLDPDTRRLQKTWEGMGPRQWLRGLQRRPPGPLSSRSAWPRGQPPSPSRNALQHISTSHLDHRFKSVWFEGRGSSYRTI